MSVVTYRDNMMVADSRAYSGSHRPIGNKLKLAALDDGSVVGVVSGTVGLTEAIIKWIKSPDTEDFPSDGETSFDALVVNPQGEATFYSDTPYPSGPLKADYFAIGTGASYALGAMAHGATAAQACAIAARHDPLSGFPLYQAKQLRSDRECIVIVSQLGEADVR